LTIKILEGFFPSRGSVEKNRQKSNAEKAKVTNCDRVTLIARKKCITSDGKIPSFASARHGEKSEQIDFSMNTIEEPKIYKCTL
jgi:hypothetical protein